MFQLWLEYHPQEDLLIKECDTREEIFYTIHQWLEDNRFTCYYMRHWVVDGKEYIDFGDWHKYLYIVTIDNSTNDPEKTPNFNVLENPSIKGR